MPIPATIADLSIVAGSNSPAGSESPSLIDDYLRAQASFVAQLRDQTAYAPITIASAATTDIGSALSNVIYVTGTTTITALGTAAAGVTRTVRFAGILTLTYNATSLQLPGLANITTAANDTADFLSLGSGNWQCIRYSPARGGVIIDTGTNVNGRYYKYADGSMMCEFLVAKTSFAVTAGVGSLFFAQSGAWTYPAPFIATPFSLCMPLANGQVIWATNRAISQTNSACEFTILSVASYTQDTTLFMRAWGRWI